MKPGILIIGATGMLGKPVTHEIIKAGFPVTIMARDQEKVQREFPSAKVVKGDMKDPKVMEAALEGIDIVYLSLSVKQNEKKSEFHTESDGLALLLPLAKKKNIKRIALLSSIVRFYQGMNGFNWWVFELKHKAVKLLKDSGIPYTIFYPSNFMESLSNMYKQGNKMMLAGKSVQPMYFIAGRDYGKQVARSFEFNDTLNREYTIQGPEAFTADEAVREFMKHYKKEKLKIMRAPLGMLKFFGLFNTRMNYGRHILEALNNYPEKFEAQKSWEELGKPVTTIKDYAASL